MKIKILSEYEYQSFPIVDGMVEVNEEDLKLIGLGKKFDLTINTIVEDTSYQSIKEEKDNQERIIELKSKLSQTDYQAIKYAEGQLTKEEYAQIKAQRQAWRDEINQLENKLNTQNI